jgi:hypothetical protein
MIPTIGRIVHYQLSAQDAGEINAAAPVPKNPAHEGDIYPALVVRVWDGSELTNLQVFYDGAGSHWARSRREGDGPGTWAWPVVPAPGKRGAA